MQVLASAYDQVVAFFQTYGALAVLAVVLAVGIGRIVARLLAARERARITRGFRQRFHAFNDSAGADTAAYERLAFLAERMAAAMGTHARVRGTPPFAGRSAQKYTSVLQFIPELRMHFADLDKGGRGIGDDGAAWIYHTVDDALIGYLGALDATAKAAAKRLANPIAWLAEGVERILALPVYIAGWFGLIEGRRAAEIEQRTGFRAVAGLAALVVVATVVSVLWVGEQRTANAYRAIGATAARTVGGTVDAVISAFSDAGKAAGLIVKGRGEQ